MLFAHDGFHDVLKRPPHPVGRLSVKRVEVCVEQFGQHVQLANNVRHVSSSLSMGRRSDDPGVY
jgi:hypothetical protein